MAAAPLTLFLGGDVMTGRGIDQLLPHPSHPRLYESHVIHAGDYVALAEAENGMLPRPVNYAYIWGDTLDAVEPLAPDLRIINLETAITTSDAHWPGKGIHYRMHPGNIPCITAAHIDCCVLANNHVLDWGYRGLEETLDALQSVGVRTTGAGNDLAAAQRPARLDIPDKGRVWVFAFGLGSSGIPPEWAASDERAGVNRLPGLSEALLEPIATQIAALRQAGDRVVASIHWGGNWGYGIEPEEQAFAHALIDQAGVDVVHGHSSHHPKGIEVYHGRPILYGCGDLLNDYEGIRGYRAYRGDLSLIYLPSLDPESGELVSFRLLPRQIRRLRLNTPSSEDIDWLVATLSREGERFGTRVERDEAGVLHLRW